MAINIELLQLKDFCVYKHNTLQDYLHYTELDVSKFSGRICGWKFFNFLHTIFCTKNK